MHTAAVKKRHDFNVQTNSLIRLDCNENPLGPSHLALQAAQHVLDRISHYPDQGTPLKQKIAQMHNIQEGEIIVGSGSSEIIHLIMQAFVEPDAEVITSHYSYSYFKTVAQNGRAKIISLPQRDWRHDLIAIIAAITPATRVIYIDNPNNPLGTVVFHSELDDFLQKVPRDVLIILDEAYCQYVVDIDYPDSAKLQKIYPNVVILRSFSKAYGLAGLRIGYSISSFDIAIALNRVKSPFNVNQLAYAAANAALNDNEHMKRTVENNRRGLRQLQEAFQGCSINYIPSHANFITYNLNCEARPIYARLLQSGICTRPLDEQGLTSYLRVSVGLPHENKAFIECMRAIFQIK